MVRSPWQLSDEELVERFEQAAIRLGADSSIDGPAGYNARRRDALEADVNGFKNLLLVRFKELREGMTSRKKPVRRAVAGWKSRK